MRGLLFDVYCKFFVTGHSVAIKLLLRRTLVLGIMWRQRKEMIDCEGTGCYAQSAPAAGLYT